MADRGLDGEVTPEKARDGAGLRRGFDDHKWAGHAGQGKET